MSVTTSGVQGYEYQYKVTAYIALLVGFEKSIEVYVETKGSEDALIQIKQGQAIRNIEIQVKREKISIDISKLVSWLCHFQERKDDNNLLSRLDGNVDTTALFVTHSRCADVLLNLKNDFSNIENHEIVKADKNWQIEFNNSLATQFATENTKLQKKRHSFCLSQSISFRDINKVNKVLEKVLIWEEVFDDTIDASVDLILNKRYKIPQSETKRVYLQLLKIGNYLGTQFA